jgi:iron complex outermembrane receptor protein
MRQQILSQAIAGNFRRRLLATTSAIALSMTIVAAATPGLAQDAPISPELAQAVTTYDIPAQDLNAALLAFASRAGVQIFYDVQRVRGLRNAPLVGSFTPQQALTQLLAGTGIAYRFTGTNTVSLEAPGAGSGVTQLDPVKVQANAPPPQAEIGNLMPAYAGGEVARGGRVGLLGNRDYMNTPFSMTSYTEKYIENQQAKTIIEVVQDDPTIRPFFAQGAWNDALVIRGFTTTANSFGGLYGVAPTFVIPMNGVERVEVFRGASGMLNGIANSGAVGGTINLVPKRATDAPINEVTAQYTSNSQLGGNFDFGRRFGPDSALGLRLNAYYSDGKTTANHNNDQMTSLTAGFDFRSEATRLDADLGWTQRNINGLRAEIRVNTGLLVPAAPSSYNNASQPWQFYNSNVLYGALRFEYDFTPSTTGYLKVGGQRSTGSVLIGFPTISNTIGGTTASNTRATLIMETVSSEAGVRTRVDLGPVRHEMVLNGTYLLTQNGSAFTTIAPAAVSNIYAPIVQPTPNYFNAPTQAPWSSQQLQSSIGLIDNIFFWNDRVQLLGGGRLQRIQTSNFNAVTGLPTQATPGSDQEAITPVAAFVVKPLEKLSFYGNYIQALEPGPIAGAGLANAGQAFPSFVSNQLEVGAKLDLGNFGATLSAYSITKPSAFTNVATNMLVLDGQQRNQGIEITMFGEPLPGLKPIGGFSLMNQILTSTANGTNNGKTAPGVPNFQANVGVDWQTPYVKGLGLSGRVVYTGQTYLDAANLQPVPAWTRVDLGASYTFDRPFDGKPITVRANVLNVGNTNYWMTTPLSTLTQSAARTFSLSLVAGF